MNDLEPGWLDRAFRAIKEDSKTWPSWLKESVSKETNKDNNDDRKHTENNNR